MLTEIMSGSSALSSSMNCTGLWASNGRRFVLAAYSQCLQGPHYNIQLFLGTQKGEKMCSTSRICQKYFKKYVLYINNKFLFLFYSFRYLQVGFLALVQFNYQSV